MIFYKSVEVDVDLDDFEEEDLIEELESRGYLVQPEDGSVKIEEQVKQTIQELHESYTTGKYYEHILGKLFDQALGRIV